MARRVARPDVERHVMTLAKFIWLIVVILISSFAAYLAFRGELAGAIIAVGLAGASLIPAAKSVHG